MNVPDILIRPAGAKRQLTPDSLLYGMPARRMLPRDVRILYAFKKTEVNPDLTEVWKMPIWRLQSVWRGEVTPDGG